jgi:hypothetical protein
MNTPAPINEAKEALSAFMTRHGLTIESVFVPYSQSRNAKPRAGQGEPFPSLNWTVTLIKDARPSGGFAPGGGGRVILTTDYGAGTGHTPAAKASARALNLASAHMPERSARQALIDWEIEHGLAARFAMGDSIIGDRRRGVLRPDYVDVFSSLAMDSDVIDAGGFESWASDCGYDTDSRAAESIYRACLEIALKLRAALGDEALREAQELAREL